MRTSWGGQFFTKLTEKCNVYGDIIVPETDLVELPPAWPINLKRRQDIVNLEASLKQTGTEQGLILSLPVKHWFCNGLYAREIFIPKGTILTGKIHKTEHLVIITQGIVEVVTEFQDLYIEAPHTMITVPGTKRALFVHEDIIWTNIHATNERDINKIEDNIIAKNYNEVNFNKELEIWRG